MWELYYSFVSVGSVLVAILFTVISRFTIYRHTTKILRGHFLGEIHNRGIIAISRTLRLVLACTFPNYIQDAIYNSEFKISHHATRIEKIIAYITIISYLVFLLCIIIYYLTKWLGILEWSF
jgi:hypothetical protein